MQRGSPVVRCGVALLVLILLIAPLADAAQIGVPGGAPAPPPEARIGVPGGIASEDDPPTTWELFLVWLQARIGVPIG